MTQTNADRAARIDGVLDYYGDQWDGGEDDETILVDLLADIMHWADSHSSWTTVLDRAELHHSEEVGS